MRKYWFFFALFFGVLILFIFKNSFFLGEKVYVIYEKNERFYKNKYEDIFYYKKGNAILQFTSFKDRTRIYKEYEKVKKNNLITIDSLSKILPSSYYEIHLFDKKKLDKLKIFFIELDSIKNTTIIKEVYQSFREYD